MNTVHNALNQRMLELMSVDVVLSVNGLSKIMVQLHGREIFTSEGLEVMTSNTKS